MRRGWVLGENMVTSLCYTVSRNERYSFQSFICMPCTCSVFADVATIYVRLGRPVAPVIARAPGLLHGIRSRRLRTGRHQKRQGPLLPDKGSTRAGYRAHGKFCNQNFIRHKALLEGHTRAALFESTSSFTALAISAAPYKICQPELTDDRLRSRNGSPVYLNDSKLRPP